MRELISIYKTTTKCRRGMNRRTFPPISLQARSEWVSWCFEPSQPQRITSGLKTNFSLSPSYSLNKLQNVPHTFFKQLTQKHWKKPPQYNIHARATKPRQLHLLEQNIHMQRTRQTSSCASPTNTHTRITCVPTNCTSRVSVALTRMRACLGVLITCAATVRFQLC